jgi:hypothetical protein
MHKVHKGYKINTLCPLCLNVSFLQTANSIKVSGHFGGAVTITTKGISTIPNLTLGKPAAIFDLSVGRRLSFEIQKCLKFVSYCFALGKYDSLKTTFEPYNKFI